MKTIAFYLPQFYEFEENNRWWGEGFTEWTNVKKAVPLYPNHKQPTIPLGENYYTLNNVETMRWQISLAKQYGLYGFCFYHYWFGDGRQLMEKPVDMFLAEKSLKIPFCISWANHNWTRTWIGGDHEILMDVKYGDKAEWKKHFDYLLSFFKDDRYIKIDGKPLFIIYLPQDIPEFVEMKNFFNNLAVQNGLNGICFVAQHCFDRQKIDELQMDYFINYEPNHIMIKCSELSISDCRSVNELLMIVNRKLHKMALNKRIKSKWSDFTNLHSYDEAWRLIIESVSGDEKLIPGGFVKFDSSPRKGKNGVIFKGATPKKFYKYFRSLLRKVNHKSKKDLVFLTAWNEWGEGAYLEPDEHDQYAYLESFHKANLPYKQTLK